MILFQCNKLVRDETLNRMKLKGIITQHKLLNKPEHIAALKEKLIEESLEVKDTLTRKELVSELADLLEVFNALLKTCEVSHEEVVQAQKLIKEARGGFDNGVFVDTFLMEEDNEWVPHFRATPAKYPEIKK